MRHVGPEGACGQAAGDANSACNRKKVRRISGESLLKKMNSAEWRMIMGEWDCGGGGGIAGGDLRSHETTAKGGRGQGAEREEMARLREGKNDGP